MKSGCECGEIEIVTEKSYSSSIDGAEFCPNCHEIFNFSVCNDEGQAMDVNRLHVISCPFCYKKFKLAVRGEMDVIFYSDTKRIDEKWENSK